MTEKDVIKLFAILTVAYPKFDTYTLGDLEKAKPVVKLWAEMLADIPYEAAEAAVKKFILESPYPPTIADIRREVAEILQDPADNVDAATAWGEVVRALNHYGYYRPEEALASMSPRTAKIVRLMGWQNICMSENPAVIRGQFIKMYEIYTQRGKQEALLPPNLKQTILQIAQRRRLELIEGGKKEA